jgi:glycosyltransferase involved in cell wall biosynthesis
VDVWDIPIRIEHGQNIPKYLHLILARRLMRYVYRSTDQFIVSIVPDFELRSFGIPAGKMLLFSNAIFQEDGSRQLTVNSDAHPGFSMLCMRSTYTHQMGLDTLADAFILLKDVIPGLVLTIIGQMQPHVRVQVVKLQGLPQVRFIDYVEHEKLLEMIRDATVCVVPFKDVPDLSQTYPIKVMEYFSLGRPVIASNIAGMSRMIDHGINGLLFRAGDADDLAKKILLLYRDKQLRAAIARNAVRYDERYDCRIKNQSIVTALQRLADSPPKGQYCTKDSAA